MWGLPGLPFVKSSFFFYYQLSSFCRHILDQWNISFFIIFWPTNFNICWKFLLAIIMTVVFPKWWFLKFPSFLLHLYIWILLKRKNQSFSPIYSVILMWTHGYLFYSICCNPLLSLSFLVQIGPDLLTGFIFKLAPVSPIHSHHVGDLDFFSSLASHPVVGNTFFRFHIPCSFSRALPSCVNCAVLYRITFKSIRFVLEGG